MKLLKAVTHGQCNARFIAALPAAGHRCPYDRYLIILLRGDRDTSVGYLVEYLGPVFPQQINLPLI